MESRPAAVVSRRWGRGRVLLSGVHWEVGRRSITMLDKVKDPRKSLGPSPQVTPNLAKAEGTPHNLVLRWDNDQIPKVT